jgi:hypothetical protein
MKVREKEEGGMKGERGGGRRGGLLEVGATHATHD